MAHLAASRRQPKTHQPKHLEARQNVGRSEIPEQMSNQMATPTIQWVDVEEHRANRLAAQAFAWGKCRRHPLSERRRQKTEMTVSIPTDNGAERGKTHIQPAPEWSSICHTVVVVVVCQETRLHEQNHPVGDGKLGVDLDHGVTAFQFLSRSFAITSIGLQVPLNFDSV